MKQTSGVLKRSLPIVITCPSGNSQFFSSSLDDSALAISSSKSRATKESFSLISLEKIVENRKKKQKKMKYKKCEAEKKRIKNEIKKV